MLALVGFLMVLIIIYLLIQSKVTPMPIFVIVPIFAAAITGFFPTEIFKFMGDGVAKTWPVAVLFIFSIIFFSIMDDVGLFDPIVKFLVKISGGSVIAVTVATGVLAILTHLDGALASTLLITTPAMLPLYKKLHIRPVVLICIIGAAMSVMNLLPWGGPVARLGVILNIDVVELWHQLIPLQIVGCVITLIFAAYLGFVENIRIKKMIASGEIVVRTSDSGKTEFVEEEDAKVLALKRPKLLWFNALVTIGVIGLLCFTKIPLYGAFMIGLALALIVNFPDPKQQTARIKAHAPNALGIPAILLASGIFLGVLKGTGMLDQMATSVIYIIPDFLGPVLHLVLGAFSVPLGMALGTDSFFFGLVPLAIQVGENYNIAPEAMAYAMLIGKNYGVMVTPHAATTFLAAGLAGIELKELIKFCTPRLWILSLVSLGAAIVMGIVPL